MHPFTVYALAEQRISEAHELAERQALRRRVARPRADALARFVGLRLLSTGIRLLERHRGICAASAALERAGISLAIKRG